LNSPIPKRYYAWEKFLDLLHITEIYANLVYFCLNLVAMATRLPPLKIRITYLNSRTPKTLLFMQKNLDYFHCRTKICEIFDYSA